MSSRRSNRLLAGVVVAAGLAMACDDKPVVRDMTTYGDAGTIEAIVHGFVWDPEAFWWMLGTCQPQGPACPLPPVQVPNTPVYEVSKVSGAIVGLFDPTQPTQTMPLPFNADAPTGEGGGWSVEHVPMRTTPYFPFTLPPPTAGGGSDGGGSPVPPGRYFPTFSARAISTEKSVQCLGMETALISDSGILEAVSKHLGLADASVLLNPAQFGGVVVSWLYQGGDPSLRVPAFGAFTRATGGTSYDIRWLPPGAGPPPIVARQSKRGFFVNTDGPTSTVGVAIAVNVFTFPPLTGPPVPVLFSGTDPVTDSAAKRPYVFPLVPPFAVSPGIVTSIGSQGIDFSRPPPPAWVCLPQ